MARRLVGLFVLLFLLGTSVVSYSLAILGHRTTALLVTTDTSRLQIDCTNHHAGVSTAICHSAKGRVTLDLAGRPSVEGQVGPHPTRTGLGGSYFWSDLVQVRNQTGAELQLDIDIQEGWPGTIGVCAFLAPDSGQVWFVAAGGGDTGYVYPLGPYSTVLLSFELRAQPGGGLSALSAVGQPTIIVEAATSP